MANTYITFRLAARVWWAWLWRSLLIGCGVGIVIGIVLGVTAFIIGIDIEAAYLVFILFIAVCGLFLSIWILKTVLNRILDLAPE